jgi:hypothetical protein
MDETLHELVSRYIDGDLEDAESARLEARAATDSELAAAIDAALELRTAVASLAASMEPPAALDRVMEPLCQSAPAPARSVRPLYRWLGAAAAVVLGVSVAVEVARRNPEPTLGRPASSPQQPAQDRDEIFELAPLPTASPDTDRPLGAADHLLEEKPAQPAAPEPAPLEVIGPLPTEATSAVDDGSYRSRESSRSSAPAATPEGTGGGKAAIGRLDERTMRQGFPSTGDSTGAVSPAPAKAAPSSVGDDRLKSAGGAGNQGAAAGPSTGREQHGAIEVVVRIDGADRQVGVRLHCTAGVRPVRIVVVDGTVVEIDRIGDRADNEIGDECRLDDLIGATLAGVGDGSHRAEIVIGDPSP